LKRRTLPPIRNAIPGTLPVVRWSIPGAGSAHDKAV